MKLVALCEHIEDQDGRIAKLSEDVTQVSHEGRFIVVVETCPACTPDFLPQNPNGPFSPEVRARLVEELRALWRGDK